MDMMPASLSTISFREAENDIEKNFQASVSAFSVCGDFVPCPEAPDAQVYGTGGGRSVYRRIL